MYYKVEPAEIAKSQTESYRIKPKAAIKDIGITYNVGTDSLRKTFGCISVMIHPEDIDSLDILRIIFEHPDIERTKKYIGIDEKRKQQYYLDMSEIFNLWEKRTKNAKSSEELRIGKEELREVLIKGFSELKGNKDETVEKIMEAVIKKSIQ